DPGAGLALGRSPGDRGQAGGALMDEYVSKIDRRTAIAWMGAVGAAVGAGVVVAGCQPGEKPAEAKGYGTDPNLVKPAKAPWPRILTADELQIVASVCDYILPASGTAPGANELGVPDVINEWVSAPYPDQAKDRPIIQGGLKWLQEEAHGRHRATFPSLSP